MSYLENAKQYTGTDLEQIFFRPMLTGPSAIDLGVRVLYNMPTPTTVQLWNGQNNILHKYDSTGWSGGKHSLKTQKIIDMKRVKAELGFAASDYFSMVYEKIVSSPEVNMDDLSGTQLEAAETALFKQTLAENIRATMWVGDSDATTGFNTFDGFLKSIQNGLDDESIFNATYTESELENPASSIKISTTCGCTPPANCRTRNPKVNSPSSSRRTSTGSTKNISIRKESKQPTRAKSTAIRDWLTTAFRSSTSTWAVTSTPRRSTSRSVS